MKTGPSTADWSIELFSFERTVLQFGSDGGPRVVHGVSRPDAAIFMLQIAKTEQPVFFDGRALRWHDMAVLAPGSHFTFASHAPARWIAFSVANELIEDLLSVLKVDKPVLQRNLAVSLSRKSAREFAETVVKVRSLVQKSKIGMGQRGVERTLLESLRAIFSDRNSEVLEPDPQILTVEKRITIALEYVRSRPTENISVNDIVGAVGISARALYRGFQSYMKLRRRLSKIPSVKLGAPCTAAGYDDGRSEKSSYFDPYEVWRVGIRSFCGRLQTIVQGTAVADLGAAVGYCVQISSTQSTSRSRADFA